MDVVHEEDGCEGRRLVALGLSLQCLQAWGHVRKGMPSVFETRDASTSEAQVTCRRGCTSKSYGAYGAEAKEVQAGPR